MGLFDKFKKKKAEKTKSVLDLDNRWIEPGDFLAGSSMARLLECRFMVDIWNNKCTGLACMEFSENRQSMSEEELGKYCDELKAAICWLKSNKAGILQALVDNGMFETAIDWAESCDTVEHDGKIYYQADDGLIPNPITQQHFLDSIRLKEISAYRFMGDENENFNITLFLVTKPDYFSYHAIQVSIDVLHEADNQRYNISVDSLVG